MSIAVLIPPALKWWAFEPWELEAWKADTIRRLEAFKPNLTVVLGSIGLELLTSEKSIDKWQLSILDRMGQKILPILHPDRIQRVYKEYPFMELAAQRIAEESRFPELKTTYREFLTNTGIDQSIHQLRRLRDSEWLSVDIETAAGQITCVGFSDDPKWAISIPTHPRDFTNGVDFKRIWNEINETLRRDSKKVLQNGIYDRTYLSRYGVQIQNFYHDTMRAQKFLHPELSQGLDTIARIYTREPYWKDEGKDWQLNADRTRLYTYNCKDVAITLEAAWAQRGDLLRRGLMERFNSDSRSVDSRPCFWGMRKPSFFKSSFT